MSPRCDPAVLSHMPTQNHRRRQKRKRKTPQKVAVGVTVAAAQEQQLGLDGLGIEYTNHFFNVHVIIILFHKCEAILKEKTKNKKNITKYYQEFHKKYFFD